MTHGHGKKLRQEYDRIMNHLSLPNHLQERYKQMDKSETNKNSNLDEILLTLKNNFSEDQICIFPSFYKFLIHLHKHKVKFSLVMRTFGTDLPMVVNELN